MNQFLLSTLLSGFFSLAWGAGLEPQFTLGAPLSSFAIEKFNSSFTGSVECREFLDIPAAYVCLTENQETLQHLMGRVSYFVEGTPGRIIVSETNKNYTESEQYKYDGHDIEAKDFYYFYARMDFKCFFENSFCPNRLEAELRRKILSDARHKNYSNFVVIAMVAQTSFFSETFSHELLHARFFLNINYQNAVDKFWKTQVSAQDQLQIIEILQRIYNLKNQSDGYFLLLNEFQAFILQKDAQKEILGAQALKYAEPLRKVLQQIDVRLL